MRNQGIGSWTARRARKTPGRVAVVHGEDRYRYAELHERVVRLANGLRARGVRRGDRVGYLGPNHPAYLETLFAAGMLGAVFVPINSRLAAPEIRYCRTDSGASVLVYAAEHAALARPGTDIALGDDYDTLLAGGAADPIDEPVTLDDPCLIMYTSGTTGKPKGAVLSHGNLTWNALNVLVDIDLAADEVTLVVAPLFHTAALNMTCLPTLLKGGTVVLEPKFDPDRVLRLIPRHRITYLFGVPTMYEALLRSPEWTDADLSSVRQLNCGGAPVPAGLIRAYAARGLAFSQGYGMTEASPGTLYLAREDAATRIGSAGVPHFFTDVRVVDPDGADMPPGGRGEVLVSGPNVMRGYWGRPEETAAALRDGWFHTGDIAEIAPDGYLSIVDRMKDVIISGGENIYPAEVETALAEHPAVAECAVIGVPHPKWGEVGRAVVVAVDGATVTERELLDHLAGRLARYKVPKSVIFTDALPRNATGKLLRRPVRDRFGRDQEGENR